MSNIHAQNNMAKVAKPGHFNDPDMLQIGNVGLTVVEQYSHMSLWSVAGAPLLAGTDLIHASNQTLAILANPEVTAINQDLGLNGAIQGAIVQNASNTEVWAKHLADGNSVGVVFLNLGDVPADITATWKSLSISGKCSIRNLWTRTDEGTAENSFRAKAVPSHGTVFLKITCGSV